MKKPNLILLTILLTAALFSAFNAPKENEGYNVGDKASDFKLKNVDGKMFSLADIKETKGFIVVFTCNHCPFAKMYENRIIALHETFAPKGYPVVAINPNDATAEPEDSFERMVARAEEKKYPFPYLIDETQQVARQYGAARTPHVFVLQKENGVLKVAYIGAIDNKPDNAEAVTEKYVANAVNELLAGRTVTTNSTRAIGCTIKWKE